MEIATQARHQFDANLIQRYDCQGPRYTSYPSAAEFIDSFEAEDLAQAVAAANCSPDPAPLSLYVHVPFCRSLCYYCGCNKQVTRHREKFQPYIERVLQEAQLHAALVDPARLVRQLHLGGGTPTYLSPQQLHRLLTGLRGIFPFADKVEASIEIDPRTVDAHYMIELRQMGFNRLSLGVQDFDPAVQVAVNRVQPKEQVRELLEIGRTLDFDSISFDLIYGLPAQTIGSFCDTLQQVVQLAPDRLAIYNYAHLPHRFRSQRLIDTSLIPSPSTKLAILGLALRKLDVAGYQYIGMDHFARPADSLSQALNDGSLQRNFQGYSTHAACDLIGLGVSAISNPAHAYAQNSSDLRTWEHAVDQGRLPVARGLRLSRDDRIRADVIGRIMCQSVLNYAAIGKRWRIDFDHYFAPELARLQPLFDDGLIEPQGGGFSVTARGRLLLRIVAMVFDRYRGHVLPPSSGQPDLPQTNLNHKQEPQTQFSKVI